MAENKSSHKNDTFCSHWQLWENINSGDILRLSKQLLKILIVYDWDSAEGNVKTTDIFKNLEPGGFSGVINLTI